LLLEQEAIMGFAYDTAIITSADLFSIAGEQNIDDRIRQTGETDFTKIYKQATNALIRALKSQGIDYASVTNTQDFKEELVYWSLAAMYMGDEAEAMPGVTKSQYYKKMYAAMVAGRVIEIGNLKIYNNMLGLPVMSNLDSGDWFRPYNNLGSTPIAFIDTDTFRSGSQQNPQNGVDGSGASPGLYPT